MIRLTHSKHSAEDAVTGCLRYITCRLREQHNEQSNPPILICKYNRLSNVLIHSTKIKSRSTLARTEQILGNTILAEASLHIHKQNIQLTGRDCIVQTEECLDTTLRDLLINAVMSPHSTRADNTEQNCILPACPCTRRRSQQKRR